MDTSTLVCDSLFVVLNKWIIGTGINIRVRSQFGLAFKAISKAVKFWVSEAKLRIAREKIGGEHNFEPIFARFRRIRYSR